MIKLKYLLLLIIAIISSKSWSCSVLYYVDSASGNIYVVNSEDYWFDVKPYIKIEPGKKEKHARLWYGWKDFAQGGINDQGLFFDGAVTPEQSDFTGKNLLKGNFGDQMLSTCSSTYEAISFLENANLVLNNAHMMIGDKNGKAVVIEWVEGKKHLHWIENNRLVMTNFLLSDPQTGNYPCTRYESINKRLDSLEGSAETIDLLKVGNTFGESVQPEFKNEDGRAGGTLYTSFINITTRQFVLSYRLSNDKVIKIDLNNQFSLKKSKKIRLDKL